MRGGVVRVTLAIAAAVVFGGSVAFQAAQAEPPLRSSNDGVYTNAQAEAGRVLFQDVCLACHPDPLWRPGWPGRTLDTLFSIALTSMPDDNPGSLSPEEVAEALAYILQSNGAPAGNVKLPADAGSLSAIRIDEPVEPQ